MCIRDRAPAFHGLDDGAHGFSQGAKRVFHPRRHLGVDGANDDAVRLHRAQAVCEHFLADSGQIALQLIEAPGPLKQIAHGQQLPLAADQLHGSRYRAGGHFFLFDHAAGSFQCCILFHMYTEIILQYAPAGKHRQKIPIKTPEFAQELPKGDYAIKKCVLAGDEKSA